MRFRRRSEGGVRNPFAQAEAAPSRSGSIGQLGRRTGPGIARRRDLRATCRADLSSIRFTRRSQGLTRLHGIGTAASAPHAAPGRRGQASPAKCGSANRRARLCGDRRSGLTASTRRCRKLAGRRKIKKRKGTTRCRRRRSAAFGRRRLGNWSRRDRLRAGRRLRSRRRRGSHRNRRPGSGELGGSRLGRHNGLRACLLRDGDRTASQFGRQPFSIVPSGGGPTHHIADV